MYYNDSIIPVGPGVILWGIISSSITLAVSFYIVYRYSRKEVHIVAKLTTVISYFMSFSIIYLIPLDLIPQTHDVLSIMWKLEFWCIQIFTWLWAGLVQDYFDSGAFDFYGRAKHALIFNFKILAVLLFIGIVFLIYIAIVNNFTQAGLMGFVAAISNTIGLTLHILMMGWGLVDMPKKLWHEGSMVMRMKHYLYKIKAVEEEYDLAKQEIVKCINMYNLLVRKVGTTSPLLEFVNQIELPNESERKTHGIASLSWSGAEKESYYIKLQEATEVTLELVVECNFLARRAYSNLQRCKTQWENTIDKSIKVEADLLEMNAMLTPPAGFTSEFLQFLFTNKYGIRLLVMRSLATIFGLMSILVLWCEITMFASSSLSPFAVILEDNVNSYGNVLAVTTIPLVYICGTSFYTAFTLRWPGLYSMHDGGHTDCNSLLYNAQLLLRLVLGISYNYMIILRVNKGTFIEIMGSMDVVPLFGSGFVLYFPILTAVFCCFTFLDVWGWMYKMVGGKVIESGSFKDDNLEVEFKILAAAKKKRANLLAGKSIDDSIIGVAVESTRELFGFFGINAGTNSTAGNTSAPNSVRGNKDNSKYEQLPPSNSGSKVELSKVEVAPNNSKPAEKGNNWDFSFFDSENPKSSTQSAQTVPAKAEEVLGVSTTRPPAKAEEVLGLPSSQLGLAPSQAPKNAASKGFLDDFF